MKKIISFMVIIVSLCLFTSCKHPSDNEKLKVVTTIFPIYDMVRYIGGDLIDTTLMVAPGQDIHSYDPSTGDIIEAKKCDALIYIGDNMETWVPDLILNSDLDRVIVELSKDDRIDLESLEHHDEHQHKQAHKHDVDMHIWTNPAYAIIMVEQIEKALITIDPANEKIYEENALGYINELENIIDEIQDIVENAQRKTLYFGSPFAFYYFTRQFGLDYFSIYETCSVEIEPTIDKIIKMNTELKNNDIPVVYTKELLNDRIARKVIVDTNSEICLLHSGHNVSIDDFNQGITFLDIWQNNIEALKRGLL